jgi:S1-C subfamily serine protease
MKIKERLKKIRIGHVILTLLLICNLVALGLIGYTASSDSTALIMLQNKLEIFAQYHTETVNKIITEYNKILIASSERIIELEETIEDLKASIEERKPRDLENVDIIKQANLYIINVTQGYSGSGTHVKINDKSYILTCAHLYKEEGDKLVAKDDNGFYHFTEVVKINEAMDLMLLKTGTLEEIPYLEISDIFPEEGSEVIVIGNPSGLINMITDGIISQIDKTHYIITNKIYFGNSGGALIYKDKVIGVVSQIAAFSNITPFGVVAQNYGIVVKLEHIKTFLGDLK